MAGEPVVAYKDFKALKQIDENGNVTDIDMPEPSNVLQYFTASGHKVSVRPSGTEPKIKFYMEAKGTMATRGDYAEADAKAAAKIEAMKKSLGI
jgi:phosphoglucomutase